MTAPEQGGERAMVARIVDGRWEVMQRRATGPTHGLASTYRSQAYACRCESCRAATAARNKRENASRRDRLRADPTLAEHGLVSTYNNWGCRCQACSAAHSERLKHQKKRRVDRLRADPSIREHGTRATYKDWGCRCDECLAAVARYLPGKAPS